MQLIPMYNKSHVDLHQEHQEIQSHTQTASKSIITVMAIIVTLIGAGYLLGGIPLPKGSMGSIFDPLPIYKDGLGAVNGYVIGSSEVPILGTIMVAAEQSGQFHTISAGVEPDGKYVFQDLKPGKYMMIAFFPNGEHRMINNIAVEPNSVQTLIFKY